MKAIIGRKLQMTQLFLADGNVAPVTPVRAGPCVVTQRKTADNDGYEAVQLGFDPARNANKPEAGHFAKHKLNPMKVLREVRDDAIGELKVGDEVKVDVFAEGDMVHVVGYTKGRGFSGGMKRWGWKGGKASHGSMSHRRIGSVGSNTYPGRPWKGRTLPGRYGNERVTLRNLKIVKVDAAANLLYVSGSIPGPISGLVMVRGAK